ncbi:MAG: hypothetical protein GKR94_31225 [Gammaproteobacteria bacterium]|nr:hypothetical protein [Gammaproteobacteria bacterium]
MKERWLYCEGQSDAPVLKAVFAALAIDAIPESTGGNPAEIARWQHENGVAAASISDRDYRSLADCDASYNVGSVKFLWRRHSIENYLLEPVVVSKTIENIKHSLQAMPHPPACTENLPENNINAIKNDLVEAGKQIIRKECGCLCIHNLWVDLRESLGRIQQRIPCIFTSGNNTTEEECVTALKAEVSRLVSAASEASIAQDLQEAEIAARYATRIAQMQQESYWQDMTFLHEFHGKRLLRELRQQLDKSYGFHPPSELFFKS